MALVRSFASSHGGKKRPSSSTDVTTMILVALCVLLGRIANTPKRGN